MSATASSPAMELEHFGFDVVDGVAVVAMDVRGDKVNTVSPKLEADLGRILGRLEDDASIRAVVITSRKRDNFLAGADIEAIRGIDSAAAGTAMSKVLQDSLLR